MKKNIYFEQNPDNFDELSYSIAKLVEDLQNFKKSMSESSKDQILVDLENMFKLIKRLNGIAEKKFIDLRNKITLYLDNYQDFDKIMVKCVELQNQLWEL
jgi:hypothetical protein